MNQRPRASLGRVLDDLGDTLLELIHGDPDNPDEIDGVVIHDPIDEPHYPPHAIVLGVGVTAADMVPLTRDLGRRGVVGLVVRAPVTLTPEIREAVDESAITLLGIRRGATWAQLSVLLRAVLAEDDIGVGEPESLGGLPAGDLFAVANAVAALLDAPVTIEDRSSRVLAFSGRQDEADASRVETIIGRQVPERYARMLTERGVFRDLYREDKPVIVDPQQFEFDDITKQRVAIAVRAGDQVLGSIWAVMEGDVTGERTAALQDAAKLVALHLLRVRAGADVHRRLRTDLIGTALEGEAGAQDALRRLGLSGRQVVVMAAAVCEDADRGVREEQDRAAKIERLADAFAVHVNSAVPAAAVAAVSGVVWAL
ncbi:MAG: PucR family transcriptional regulator, partial [Nocardioidaceae bacterium]